MTKVTRMAGKNVVRVYLLDNSMKTLLVDDDATAQSVVLEMCQKLGLRNCDVVSPCFGLHECLDGVTISPALADSYMVVPVMALWPEGSPAKFVLTVKLIMESPHIAGDPKVLYMHYIQMVYNVITGIYPTSVDECVSLASLQLQSKFGDHNPAVHKVGYLAHQLKGLIPSTLIPRKTPSQWEAEILGRHSLLTPEARAHPMLLYTNVLKAREYYGCAFFPVSQTYSPTLPKYLMLAVGIRGIFLLRMEDKIVLERHFLADIYRWGFTPAVSFYFELKVPTGGGGTRWNYNTLQGAAMSELLTDYAMMLLREMGLASGGGSAGAGDADPGSPAPPAVDPVMALAAVRIQSVYRGYQLRNELHRQFAATRIQSIIRGFLARCRFDKILEDMEREIAEAEA